VSDTDAALLAIAQSLTRTYLAHTRPQAVLLVGSAAAGLSDNLSDLDLIAYYDTAPPEEQLAAAHIAIAGDAYSRRGAQGEEFFVNGVHCDVAHFLVEEAEQRFATVLEQADPASTVHKHLMGVLDGKALHGEELIARWQLRARQFPEPLRVNMIEHYLRLIFPLWYFQAVLERRDACLWIQQELVQVGMSILGMLAGVNRVYFSPFQFKRTKRFVAQLHHRPADVAERIDGLFESDLSTAIRTAEQLVAETLAIVDREVPEANTALLRYPPGERQQPWSIPAG
jgi:hypothetical protein